ncbi:serine/threonine-protein kinase [Glycomyces dulcitolivorans]|uniref:serine/threonine-protein kinase n=1 Tax=Glycomyces dulcitolivorans TaxID=2200759 RepID=UPI000DD333FF|nr:serine/threonine-protein kinase [Glycomyces dulcitolivorans]
MQRLSPNDPDRIGPYRVFAELGRGAMGRVLLGAGHDGRLVAVKVIREWLREDEEFLARFREEVRKSRQVSGLYTAAVVQAKPDDPVPWLASEFLRGPTLDEAVKGAGPLPEAAVIRLAAGLASALEAIHAAGVIHRDLKPGNVILEGSGPRVIDFGIARAAEGSDLTRTGALIGTPGFMSPEQTQSEPLTAASDVFSLGSVLVMACTGTGPFTGASTLATMNNVVRADPNLDGVPVRVRALVERCLAADPGDRPTPAELLQLIGPVTPSSRPWPDAVTALAEEQESAIARLLDDTGEGATRIDNGPTLVTDPNRRTWVVDEPPQPEPVAPPVPPRPPIDDRPKPPKPPTDPSTPARVGVGAAVVLVVAVISTVAWAADRANNDDDDEGQSPEHATYVEECRDYGYSEAECEESWPNDPSLTWTGQLYTDEPTPTYETYETYETEETTSSDVSGQRDVYVQECQYDGYSAAECDASWFADSSYTWTGVLYGDDEPTDKDVYVQECVNDGYAQSDCESSWYADPSYTWTGELF